MFTDILPDDADTGVTWTALSGAISTWAWMQERPVTVAEAAATFNTTPEHVREAIDQHPWAYLEGDGDDPTAQFIEHDGA
ncbi:hypothetical protein [Nitrospirillum amazonense]|uniref:hypothetical protein n=1 Tax=Nitrospirillum amazonense TaxID=28077 RepID=UPI002412C566|nr:hypothetical protein [Nitrospirillum amazonense]MDG3444668.1 hypothetical protein [Nitrospirillum amazonense]